MKLFLAICVVACVFAAPSFDDWSKQFGKEYFLGDMAEYSYRRSVYEQNVADIERINNENTTWTAGVNAYSDLTWEEFKARFLGGVDPQHCSATGQNGKSLPKAAIPDSIDWNDGKHVTKVKNQGSCGSCWTFSTVGALESAHAIAGHGLRQFAEQQLVDCAGGFKNNGCNGGLPSQAFQYYMWAGGAELESDYKYTAKDGSCKFSQAKIAAKIADEFNITLGDESDTGLPGAIAKGPVSICYQVASDFRNYRSGVYNSKICKNGPMDVNHAVLAVGYGTENGTPYYNVKNSWGTSFGMSGYFKIIRGKNMCGLATCSSFPIVDK